jgi:hypothetical protein
MCNGHERREYKRREKLYMAEVRVKRHEGHETESTGWDSVTLHNLSVGGTFFVYRKDLEIGTLLDLKIDGTETMRTINCVGKVTRAEQFQSTSMFCTAIKFVNIRKKEKETINTSVAEDLEQANKTAVA